MTRPKRSTQPKAPKRRALCPAQLPPLPNIRVGPSQPMTGPTTRARNKTAQAEAARARGPQLLDLPKEILDHIWDLVAADTKILNVNVRVTPMKLVYDHPFNLVCRQIYRDFRKRYFIQAPRYAQTVRICLTNFVYRGGSQNLIRDPTAEDGYARCCDFRLVLENIPPPAPGVERRYKLDILLDNFWDTRTNEVSALCYGRLPSDKPLTDLGDFEFHIRFNPKTFDVHYARNFVNRCYYLRLSGRPLVNQMRLAIDEALERHDVALKLRQRKRKRIRAIENGNGGQKKGRKHTI